MYGTNPNTMECIYKTPCGLCVKYDKTCDKQQGKTSFAEDTQVLSTKLVKMIYDFSRGRIHTDNSSIQEYIKDHLEKECPGIKTWGDD